MVRVIVVRHGERLDESDSTLWEKIRTQETMHDPPLTAVGWEQAERAGTALANVLPGHSALKVYCSPTDRTISTAAGLLTGIGHASSEITPCYSLNCCEAAQIHGVANAFPKQEKPSLETTAGFALACWPPMGNAVEVDKNQSNGSGFVEAVKAIAETHKDHEVILMVTHREGVWQLQEHVGMQVNAGYCHTSYYTYDSSKNTLASWDPASNPSRGTSQMLPDTTEKVYEIAAAMQVSTQLVKACVAICAKLKDSTQSLLLHAAAF
eukprot:CAMPEP_0169097290 /NCGR_PEP_ID=MMETSP1015-20121227/19445_1 /TAXON_ID=342587 /ORGANISM="Karlodinium micrum, Strain CCMP2283" /LENGTH=265 /DNA_ID=CAMNT_0009158095 /DNA_START=41 /DNA_END=838 /DNA_ORIENTATION=+